MSFIKMKKILLVLSLVLTASSIRAQQKTENVILITLDGLRWQELFGGADPRLLTKAFVSDSARTAQVFWADKAAQRRLKLFPFFWSVIATQGQLLGNREVGNFVNVTNNQWFSYPGYSELLCGFADDERIRSNDKFDNPNTNVLEFLNQQPRFKGKVAAFCSWDVFPFIINTRRSGVPVNAGLVEKVNPNEKEKWINELMHQVPNPLGDVRLDAFTFHYAFEYLKREKPRVLYIGFDETDDFAHRGQYDLYLHSARYTDEFIQKLWSWCQQQKQYRGKTTLIITTDHGRGSARPDDWRHHGSGINQADEIWLAVIGPDTPALGEVTEKGQLYQNQVAHTLARFLGLNYQSNKPVGVWIQSLFK
jgi:hypothetical protein